MKKEKNTQKMNHKPNTKYFLFYKDILQEKERQNERICIDIYI